MIRYVCNRYPLYKSLRHLLVYVVLELKLDVKIYQISCFKQEAQGP